MIAIILDIDDRAVLTMDASDSCTPQAPACGGCTACVLSHLAFVGGRAEFVTPEGLETASDAIMRRLREIGARHG